MYRELSQKHKKIVSTIYDVFHKNSFSARELALSTGDNPQWVGAALKALVNRGILVTVPFKDRTGKNLRERFNKRYYLAPDVVKRWEESAQQTGGIVA